MSFYNFIFVDSSQRFPTKLQLYVESHLKNNSEFIRNNTNPVQNTSERSSIKSVAQKYKKKLSIRVLYLRVTKKKYEVIIFN